MTQSLSDKDLVKYYRQVLLPEVEEAGQAALLEQHVLIVGMGGLGTHVAQQLAAAGIGHLHMMDDDVVELSNLPRQILFKEEDIGKAKVDSAATCLSARYPETVLSPYATKFDGVFTKHFCDNEISEHEREHSQAKVGVDVTTDEGLVSESEFEVDKSTNAQSKRHIDKLIGAAKQKKLIVLDCSDNMQTRQAVNTWCVAQSLPLVSAAVTAFSGQLLTVCPDTLEQAGCYRCVFDEQESQANCASQGVLGPSVAVVASMQAMACLNHILGIYTSTKLHLFDAKSLQWRAFERRLDSACPSCSKKEFSHDGTATLSSATQAENTSSSDSRFASNLKVGA